MGCRDNVIAFERAKCSGYRGKEKRKTLTLGMTSPNLITKALVNADRRVRFYV